MWFHLQFATPENELRASCQCPTWNCFHEQFLSEYFGAEISPDLHLSSAAGEGVTYILCLRF